MNDLDDPALIQETDPSDFLGSVERLPDQVRDAHERARRVEGLPPADGIDSIAVLGMGGSGISGDVLQVALGPRSPLFVATLRGYELPDWVDRNTLVFAMSYSGNTEETLETFEKALERNIPIVAVTTGGALSQRAKQHGLAVVEIPAGLQPRAALGYLAVPLLVVCERIGAGPPAGEAVSETIDLLQGRADEYHRKSPLESNPAKELAQRLLGKIPVVYGSEGLAEVAAYRWKCQFNEVAKVPAWSNSFPELNHNEIVGWERLGKVTRAHAALLVLRDEGEHPRIAKRIDITLPLIQGSVSLVHQVRGRGASALARLFDLVYFGDFVSTYLAIAQGVDPAPVEVIESLKRALGDV